MYAKRLLASVALFTVSLQAQQLIETFSYTNGPVPGWTRPLPSSATWLVNNGRLTKIGGSTADFLLKDGIVAKNCVLDVEVFYTSTFAAFPFGGLAARYVSTSSPLLYCKIQDNGGAADLERMYLFESYGAGQSYADIGAGITSAVIRMLTVDRQSSILVDKNKDGVFDQELAVNSLSTVLGPGQIACTMHSSVQLDNFKFYDGVLLEQSQPKVGTTYKLRFATPVAQSTPWVAAFALSNRGIPIGMRSIPLALDPLFTLTLGSASALGLAGTIDGNGDGLVAFPVPNNASFVGFVFFAAAVTLDPFQPFSIGTISQDLRAVIQI